MTQAPPPGPPQYGQPQYGQPPPVAPGGPPPQSLTPGSSFGVTTLVFTLLGAVVAAVGILGVRWTTSTGDGGDSLSEPKFLLLRKLLLTLHGSERSEASWTIAYFSWAALVLVIATFVFALISVLPTPATPLFRVLGVVFGLTGAAATLFMPALDGTNGLSRYLSGGLGLYFVVAGSLLMVAGALAGSRRRA